MFQTIYILPGFDGSRVTEISLNTYLPKIIICINAPYVQQDKS